MTRLPGRILRTLLIILVGLTAAINLLGGVGTTCAAFFTQKYPSMAALMEFRWIYQALVILTVLAGLWGIALTRGLGRGARNAYRNTVILLAAGTLLATVHYFASLALRGKAVPANIKLYLNLITLLFALLLGLPGLRKQLDFSPPGGKEGPTASGLAAILAGMVVLSAPVWAASSHTKHGVNWVDLLATPLALSGWALLFIGSGLLAQAARQAYHREGSALEPRNAGG